MASSRSSAIECFCSHAGSIFPDIDAALFPKSAKRSQDPQIHKLLRLTGDPFQDRTPPMLAPVLFKDEDIQSMSKLFRNPALFQVCLVLIYLNSLLVIFTGFQIGCLIVYRPTALNTAKMTLRSDNMYIQDGQFPKTTFGFIAWIATMVSPTRISIKFNYVNVTESLIHHIDTSICHN